MIDTKAIRNKILDLAIRGKLTEQLPEDGTAEQLYQQIQEEKQALIQSGKIKKEKPLPEINPDEIPFEISKSWTWVRLGEIASILGGKRIPAGRSLTQENTGHKYIRVSEMKNRTVITDGLLYVPNDIYPTISQYIINKEDVYITVAGTIGRVGKIPPEIDGANLTENADRIVFSRLDQDWLILCLSSSEVQKQIDRLTTSVAQPKLAIKRIQEFCIPLPPLAEQKRIVEKIEQAFSVLDTIDELQVQYADNLTALKSKLIDLAIRGKLTEQLPEDGTAEELYQQIQEEKQALIKSGKIKKEKPLPEIEEDEIPFEIPENWKWVRLGEFGSWHAGATPSRGISEYYNGSIPWLKTGDLNDGYITSVSEYITELALEKCSVQLNPVGSVLIAMYGATIGKLGIADIPLTTNQACCACILNDGINNRFLFFLLMSMRKAFIGMGIGGAQSNISREKIVNAVVPLPPFPEQKRIVGRLDKLLAVCDEMRYKQL